MTKWQLLVVDHVLLDLFMEPCNIFHVGQVIVGSVEDGYWEAKVFKVVLWRLALVVLLHVHLFAMVESPEFWLSALCPVELTVMHVIVGSGVGWQVR